MIRLGVCATADKAAVMKKIGYDYIELNLTSLSEMSDEQFAETKRLIDESGLRAEACNSMLPGKYRLTGDNADLGPVREYLLHVIPRAAQLGARVIVFGSGAARMVPERFQAFEAWGQLVQFLRMVREILERYDIRLVVEPLNNSETNIVYTVREAAALTYASRVAPDENGFLAAPENPDINALDTIGALGDTYHMYRQGEGYGSFADAGKLLYHVHTAENVRRVYPNYEDGTDYAGLFRALIEAGYDGRVSVEGSTNDFEEDAKRAFEVLKSAMADQ